MIFEQLSLYLEWLCAAQGCSWVRFGSFFASGSRAKQIKQLQPNRCRTQHEPCFDAWQGAQADQAVRVTHQVLSHFLWTKVRVFNGITQWYPAVQQSSKKTHPQGLVNTASLSHRQSGWWYCGSWLGPLHLFSLNIKLQHSQVLKESSNLMQRGFIIYTCCFSMETPPTPEKKLVFDFFWRILQPRGPS